MREAGLLAPTPHVRKRSKRLHTGRITTDTPDELWATDPTEGWTRHDGRCAVFAIVDHCTARRSGRCHQPQSSRGRERPCGHRESFLRGRGWRRKILTTFLPVSRIPQFSSSAREAVDRVVVALLSVGERDPGVDLERFAGRVS